MICGVGVLQGLAYHYGLDWREHGLGGYDFKRCSGHMQGLTRVPGIEAYE